MAYLQGNPNGELYIGSVKWGSDYKNVVNFGNTANRDNFLKTHLTKVKSNVVYFNPNGIIKIDSKIQGIANYNYVFFRNDSDISSHYYCCFITNYEYTAPQTTTLYIQLDVFQTYFYGTRFYNSYIERCHIPKSDDIVGKWMAPEPISFTPDFEKNIDILDGISWKPNWVAYCLSSTPSGGGDYTYGGSGSYDSFTGVYAFSLGGGSGVETLLKRYYKGDDVTDHRSDIIGVYAVPEWCLTPFVPKGIDQDTLSVILFEYLIESATTSAPTLPNTETVASPLQIFVNKSSSIFDLPEISIDAGASSSNISVLNAIIIL